MTSRWAHLCCQLRVLEGSNPNTVLWVGFTLKTLDGEGGAQH